MTLPFPVPDWLPWWAVVAILVPILLYALAFVVMPFNTFGVKGRLDLIEARLDEIQGEIRSLALRLPDRGSPGQAAEDPAGSLPPVPPRHTATRSEPRLDWPR
jgi:hypothetical protein